MKTSDIIAVAAIVVSVVSSFWQVLWNYSQWKKEKRTEIFKIIYEDLLLEQLPYKREKIRYLEIGHTLSCVDDFCDLVNEMRKKTIFFRYYDNIFYSRMTKKLQELEDYLSECTNEDITLMQSVAILNNADRKLEDIAKMVLGKMA